MRPNQFFSLASPDRWRPMLERHGRLEHVETFPPGKPTGSKYQYAGSGFVVQHTVVMETASGTTISCPACLVVEVRDGLITRIDEYVDPAPFAALAGS